MQAGAAAHHLCGYRDHPVCDRRVPSCGNNAHLTWRRFLALPCDGHLLLQLGGAQQYSHLAGTIEKLNTHDFALSGPIFFIPQINYYK